MNAPWLSGLRFTLLATSLTIPALASAQDLPDGAGKATVARLCGACHDVNRVRAGYTPEGWRTVMRMMMNAEIPVPPDQWDTVTGYLAKNFPERPRPPAKIIAGPVQAAIKLWPVPTPGSRPHDPLATRDGKIWWTGQLSNRLGWVDPKTGAMKEFTLKTPMTGPHGLVEDKDGNIWFTGNHIGIIGRLDPKTGAVTEYPTTSKDPHTLIFDKTGTLWFTAQNANTISRLDPKTGAIVVLAPPTPGSRPYGMAINSKNELFVVLFGTNKIARIDTATNAIKEYLLPNAASRPRRLAIAPDDTVWYADFSRGYLGRLNPATGEVKEWLSPSGEKSAPYGIVWTKGALWYNESFAKPNTIVRFDPKSEAFQSWALPGSLGGDIVRNMDVAPDGNPVTANSLSNEVGLVEIK